MSSESEHRLESGLKTGAQGGLPPAGLPVWVRCKSFRTMAYLDRKGVWRMVANQEELKEVFEVEWPERKRS